MNINNNNQQQQILLIAVIYEDGSVEYYHNIDSSEKLSKINPHNKKYICIKIFEDEKYSTVFYGHDYVGLSFSSSSDKKVKGEQFDNIDNKNKSFDIIFEGKLLPDDKYEKLRLLCHDLKYKQTSSKK